MGEKEIRKLAAAVLCMLEIMDNRIAVNTEILTYIATCVAQRKNEGATDHLEEFWANIDKYTAKFEILAASISKEINEVSSEKNTEE